MLESIEDINLVSNAEVFNDDQNGIYLVLNNSNNQKELLMQMGEYLQNRGTVKDTFIDAVIERERMFPTGLPTLGVSVAVPHTDVDHVLQKSVIVAILENPIEFQVMGTEDQYVNVEIVFMLGIKVPSDQLTMLQKLVELCQNESDLKMIKDAKDLKRIQNRLTSLVIN